jgi:uncharacterized coiled-coil DUF342 family protein
MIDKETRIEKSITKLETEMGHVNKHLEKIDSSVAQLKELMIQQSELQKDITRFLSEHAEFKRQLGGYGKRLNDIEKLTNDLNAKIVSLPGSLKVNAFDYVWKYIGVAIGGWIALKVSGVLP